MSDELAIEQVTPQPKERWFELGGATLKIAVAGAGFLAGGPVGGLISQAIVEYSRFAIPDLRQQRVDKFLHLLAEKFNESQAKIEALEAKQTFTEQAVHRLCEPEFVDLFEESCVQAARSLSNERLTYLAKLLAESLTSEQFDYLLDKRLLSLFGELNEAEVIVLQSYSSRNERDDEFLKKHDSVFKYGRLTSDHTIEEGEKAAILDSYRNRLVMLGLLGPSRGISTTLYLTPLGIRLLKRVGLEREEAIPYGEVLSLVDILEEANSFSESASRL